jgi:hypothetical protein
MPITGTCFASDSFQSHQSQRVREGKYFIPEKTYVYYTILGILVVPRTKLTHIPPLDQGGTEGIRLLPSLQAVRTTARDPI